MDLYRGKVLEVWNLLTSRGYNPLELARLRNFMMTVENYLRERETKEDLLNFVRRQAVMYGDFKTDPPPEADHNTLISELRKTRRHGTRL